MNKFEKVSFEQFKKDFIRCFPTIDNEQYIKDIYDGIKLPKRGSKKSAGYDFFAPFTFALTESQERIIIPTGIKVMLDDDKVLKCYPRSGSGFKTGVYLANTVGLIDADYYDNQNTEGHIMCELCRNFDDITFEKDKGYMQGCIEMYFLTVDDDANEERKGGFGSTTK